MAIKETLVYVINYINTIPGRDWGSALPINDCTRLNGWIMDHGSRWIVDIQSSETFRTLSLWFRTCPEEGTGSFTTFRLCRIIALVVLTISLRYTRYNIIGRRGNEVSIDASESDKIATRSLRFTNAENFRSKGIYHRISTIYGNKIMIESFVRRWVREFNTSRETVCDRKRGGRPSLVTEDLKKRVCNSRQQTEIFE